MRTYVRRGEVVGVGSVNHEELARLQTSAKKAVRKPKGEQKSEPADESKSKEPVAPAAELKTAAKPTL